MVKMEIAGWIIAGFGAIAFPVLLRIEVYHFRETLCKLLLCICVMFTFWFGLGMALGYFQAINPHSSSQKK